VIRLAVRVRAEDAEVALAELLALAPHGVEEVDLGDRVELAVYGSPGELPELPEVEAVVGGALVEVVTEEVPDDWHERWREFHRPIELAGLRVRAPWHEAREGDVVIDPGQAFGTGRHETTQLCLELLLDLEPAGALVDAGCGSGVLAIAAARRGFDPVRAFDFDPEAVRATIENAEVNGVEVETWRHDLLRDGPCPAAPVVVANLLRPLLLRVAADGWAGEPPRELVVSGLLRHEADEVAAAFAPLQEARRLERGDWAAVLLRAT
jgi:ribosomal protein L11 methyltransferase